MPYECNVGCKVDHFNVYVTEQNKYWVSKGAWDSVGMVDHTASKFAIECPECGNVQDTVFSMEEVDYILVDLKV